MGAKYLSPSGMFGLFQIGLFLLHACISSNETPAGDSGREARGSREADAGAARSASSAGGEAEAGTAGGAEDAGDACSALAPTDKIDLLLVIDDAAGMAEEQKKFLSELPHFVRTLASAARPSRRRGRRSGVLTTCKFSAWKCFEAPMTLGLCGSRYRALLRRR